MKKLLKLSSLLLATMIIISSFAGCGKSAAVTTPKTGDQTTAAGQVEATTAAVEASAVTWDTAKKDKVVLSVINNYYTAGQKQMAKDYMALHPETEVVIDIIADNDSYVTNLKTKYETDINSAPDIVHGNFAIMVPGSWSAAYEKNYILDLTSMLEEPNPYNDNKLMKEEFNPEDVALAISNAQGKLGFMPFDWVGVGVFYNKTIFDKLGLATPTSMEEWLATCETLKAAGYEVPLSTSFVGQWVQGMYADIAYRPLETDFLALPGDAAYNEATMKPNTEIKYDANNPLFDQYAIFNTEKIWSYVKKNTFNTPLNKQIWETFGQLGQYFQKNWTNPDDAAVIVNFETQASPMMLHGSWNVGKFVDEIKQLPADQQFEWGTFKIPGFANPPAGFEAKIRSLYVYGNQMSIIPKDDQDHMSRVKDVYKYMMAPKVAQMLYEVTLANGNYVQGPPAIIGVTLSDETNAKLDGFKSEGNMKQEFSLICAQTAYLASDKPLYDSLVNQLTDKTISIDEFMVELDKIAVKYLDDLISKNGYDLDPTTLDQVKQ